jgi:hypothetical protein
MELFVIYLLTRLTDIKSGLSSVTFWMGVAVVLCLVARLINEHTTKVDMRDDKRETNEELPKDIYVYRRIKAITGRGLKMFVPVFVFAFVMNLFVPTTRDAIVIAGGYGLTEAVKNERVQRLFNKSTAVASKWLDEQLNGDNPAPATSTATTPTPASAAGTASAPAPAVRASDTAALIQQVKDKVAERVTERVADEVLGPKTR